MKYDALHSRYSRKRICTSTRMRLSILLVASAAMVSGFTPVIAVAQKIKPQLDKVQSGCFRLRVGDVEVIALSDGTVPFAAYDILRNTTQADVDLLLEAADSRPPFEASMNAFLVHLGNRLILIDAGTGELLGPTLNKLPTSLREAGYTPAQITDILLTHIHADHSGGLMDGERIRFPNAIVHVQKREIEYWLSQTEMRTAAEQHKPYFQQATKTVQPYVSSGQVKTFAGETELFPGLRAIPAPGHTPGHTFYSLESRGEKLMFMGDVVHAPEVQFVEPYVSVTYDVNQAQAIATRQTAFREAARNHILVAFAHVSFPGIGHIHQDGDHYRWNPIPFVNDAIVAVPSSEASHVQ
jgi:glyoxylase-like metal-dependent hydrolase (beta-lactamase superfamily II)